MWLVASAWIALTKLPRGGAAMPAPSYLHTVQAIPIQHDHRQVEKPLDNKRMLLENAWTVVQSIYKVRPKEMETTMDGRAIDGIAVGATVPSTPTALAEFQRAWWILLGCTLGLAVGVHSLVFYTAGLFMKALQAEFGWTRAQISLGPTVLIAALGLASPLVGSLVDRFGPRVFVAPSLIVLAAFFYLLSQIGSDIRLFYLLLIAMAVLASGSATPTFTTVLNATFDKARGTALGIGLVGTGLASTFVPPYLGKVIAGQGWRAGYVTLAAIVLVAMPVIVLLLRRAPTSHKRQTDDQVAGFTLAQAVRDTIFWKIAFCLFTVALGTAGLIVHFVPLLTDQGLSAKVAVTEAGAIGLCLIAGRVLTGVMVDRLFAPRVAATIMLVSAGCYLMLGFGGATFAFLGALGIGLSFGAEVDLVGYLTARYFGMRAYGRIYGVLYAVVLAGTALSPLAYGLVVDATRSYTLGLVGTSVLLTLSAAVFLSMRRFTSLPSAT